MTKTLLPDVNVWIALAVDSHVHHPRARAWAEGLVDDELVVCRVTQQGFLRLLTNRRVMGELVLNPEQAWATYDTICADRRTVFKQEPAELESAWRRLTENAGASHDRWTDAYLAAFAQAADLELVTFDRGFSEYRGVRCAILS